MPNKSRRSKDNEKTRPIKVRKNAKRKVPRKKADNAKTKVVDSKAINKKDRKNKKMKFSQKHPKLSMAIKIFIILFLLLCVIGAGVIVGLFFGVFGDDFEISKEELKIGASNSVIVDKDGNKIADLSGDEKRKIISIEEMSPYLPKAYVAIEDERFYKHSGVDFKRTAGAILGKLTGRGNYGGSSITQQLVKNITKDDETAGMAGIFRKVKEWAKAYQVERMITKDEILELYLNILYVGGEGNIHGVELGAQYYFGKSAKDLDLAECAFLAGINSSPNYYNPYKLSSESDTEEKRNERIKNKVLTVLSKMKELGFIENEEDYNNAHAKAEAGLTFTQGTTITASSYSYHTDAVIEQVIKQVMNDKEISRELAENYVYSSGLTIYSTVDNGIQSRIEEETNKGKYQLNGREIDPKTGEKKNEHTQAAFVLIDPKTGNVLGVSGGIGEKSVAGLNRATQSKRQPGSSIKPLACIAPGLEEKIIQACTVYDDVLTDFSGYKPKDDGGAYKGLINIRSIIAYSQNVPEVKIMRELTPAKSIEYLRKFGITSLYTAQDNPSHNDESLPLAIGGITEGISPLEMAAGYATIANNGEHITPTFYSKVVDAGGNIVMTPNQERTRVISEQNAYILKTILQEPVKYGTATYCSIPGMDVACKTGTTDNSYDRWLCGFTEYYAAACWFGYDNQEEVVYSGTNPAGQIWDAIMTDVHRDLPNASFIKPEGIVQQAICKSTGCIATEGCADVYTEIFTSDNMPEVCKGHGSQQICSETNMEATEYCSQYCEVTTNYYGAVIPKESLNLWKAVNGGSGTGRIRVEGTCTAHTKPKEVVTTTTTIKKPEESNTNTEKKDDKENTNTTSENTNTSGDGGTNTTPTPGPQPGTEPGTGDEKEKKENN